ALHDCHLHAFYFPRAHSRQRAAARPAFLAVHLRLPLPRHLDFQQSQFPGRGHAARLPHHPPQHLFLRLHLSPRNHAQILFHPQLFRPRHLFHRHHPRHHPPWRRLAASLDRRRRPLRHGHPAPRHRRPPLPEQSHHGVISCFAQRSGPPLREGTTSACPE